MANNRVANPTKSGNGFKIAMAAIVAIVVVLISVIVYHGKSTSTELVGQWEDKAYSSKISLNDDGTHIEFTSDNTAADAVQATIYEDYMCPHCATLASADLDAMAQAVADGKLKVTIAPLGFMDQRRDPNNTSGPSHQALAASLAALHAGETELYWNYRAMIYDHQAKVHESWKQEDFAEAAKELGASKQVVEDIKQGKYLDEAANIAKTNAEQLKKDTGELSSPRLFINGTEVEPDPAWVQKYTANK